MIVTYTNHAGDQLGESLHHAGVESIIRIGSRSKSEILQECNLHVVSRREERTKHESFITAMIYKERDANGDLMERILGDINNMKSRFHSALKDFVSLNFPDHHRQLFQDSVDEDGFQQVKSRQLKTPQAVFTEWVNGGRPSRRAPRSNYELLETQLSDMSEAERRKLLLEWQVVLQKSHEEKLLGAVTDHCQIEDRFKAVYAEANLRCLRNANLVIVTTSGLANNLKMLRRLHSKVLLCEEAGQVLEAHLLTTFLPSIEHAILIGDHEQLRPQVQNHDLSSASQCGAQYLLDISLFERLVHPAPGIQRLPYSTLQTQQRMHPSISNLIRSTLYPALVDADNVKKYPQVMGLRKRLFWLDHREPEAGNNSEGDKISQWNSHEVKMVTEIVRHLVKQGEYRADEIAVVTPYLGQLTHLRSSLQSSFAIVLGDRDLDDLAAKGDEPVGPPVPSKAALSDSLRLATVDNFQGEESKIVVLSLVRSNAKNNCGFLKTSNRINVALSRAKHGPTAQK